MIRICRNCDKEYETKPSIRLKYCGQKCYWESLKGCFPLWWNKRKAKMIKCENRGEEVVPSNNYLKRKHCSLQCYLNCRCKHYKHTEETKRKLSGSNHYNWKGGNNNPLKILRTSFEYKKWRQRVFKRDYWTCQICGYKGQKIDANHIYPFATYPNSRFEVENGITLCKNCHEFFRNKEKDFISWWKFYKETKWLSKFKFIEVFPD